MKKRTVLLLVCLLSLAAATLTAQTHQQVIERRGTASQWWSRLDFLTSTAKNLAVLCDGADTLCVATAVADTVTPLTTYRYSLVYPTETMPMFNHLGQYVYVRSWSQTTSSTKYRVRTF